MRTIYPILNRPSFVLFLTFFIVSLLYPSLVLVSAKNPSVAAFFYLWYGNPEFDNDQYIHWNHHTLPHWTEHVRKQYPEVRYIPPYDIHAPYYPQRGLYSSRDPQVMREQFREIYQAGIGIIIISWWGRKEVSKGDSQGVVTDGMVDQVLDLAAAENLKVALHLEPYEGRNADNVYKDIVYLYEKYSHYPALYRYTIPGSNQPPRPVYYVYDSYHISALEWQRILTPHGDLSIRHTLYDCFAIGLWLNANDGNDLVQGGFNGAYTYFSSDGFSYGSTSHNWLSMANFARSNNLWFSPSVGPGYDDTRIRPWNSAARKDREEGKYYQRMWDTALECKPNGVSITSFNEWGEGTQIEPAVPKDIPVNEDYVNQGFVLNQTIRHALNIHNSYANYLPHNPDYYLQETLRYSQRLEALSQETTEPEF